MLTAVALAAGGQTRLAAQDLVTVTDAMASRHPTLY